eukprot:4583504-Prymnesium_polylepis.2
MCRMRRMCRMCRMCHVYRVRHVYLPAVECEHTPRTSPVQGLGTIPANEDTFTDELGRQVTVAAWFAEKHPNMPLRHPHWPCVLCGPQKDPEKVRIPLELLTVAEAQPPRATPAEVAQEMIKECAMDPVPRFERIKKVAEDYARGRVGPAARRSHRPHHPAHTTPPAPPGCHSARGVKSPRAHTSPPFPARLERLDPTPEHVATWLSVPRAGGHQARGP